MLTVVMYNHIRLTESDDRIIELMKTFGEYPSKAQVVHDLLEYLRSLQAVRAPTREIDSKLWNALLQADKFVKETST
jgi:hypothetical protein